MATAHSRAREASPAAEKGANVLPGSWWKWGLGLLMAYVIYGAFFIARGGINFTSDGNNARIVFFHVPVAVLSSVCYFVGAVYAFLYLTRRPTLETDAKSAAAMEIGFVFCILATITGSVFAAAMWGAYWNWDPRETSIVVMLLLYASYLLLRGYMADRLRLRARISAVYSVVALVPALFLIWVVPRLPLLNSLHPQDTLARADRTSIHYKLVLYPSFLAFTLLFVWLFQLRVRIYQLQSRGLQDRDQNGERRGNADVR